MTLELKHHNPTTDLQLLETREHNVATDTLAMPRPDVVGLQIAKELEMKLGGSVQLVESSLMLRFKWDLPGHSFHLKMISPDMRADFGLCAVVCRELEAFRELSQHKTEYLTGGSIIRHNRIPIMISPWHGPDTLENYLQKAHSPLAKRADQLKVINLISTACLGIEELHNLGFLHADVKPNNILLDKNGTLKINDYGCARHLDRERLESERLEGGGPGLFDVSGTASYMAPELAREDFEILDGRADVFALGVMLYQALTSNLPFRGQNTMDILMSVLSNDPVSPNKIPCPLDLDIVRAMTPICLKALEKHPDNRYQTATEMHDAINKALKRLAK